MTAREFWDGAAELARFYRKADEAKRHRKNEELWLQGLYVMKAFETVLGNAFGKHADLRYPEEPLPITEAEVREKQEREQRAKAERLRAAFTAKALAYNAREKKGAKEHDTGGEADSAAGAADAG